MRSLALIFALLLGCRDKAPVRGAPAITVSVAYPGASAETIESAVVLPIERSIAKVPGLRALESRIEAEHATVMIELASIGDVDRAMQEVRHELVQLQAELPRDLLPPDVTRTRLDDQPIVWFALGSDGGMPIGELSRYANEEVVPRLERIRGVGAVEPHGVADLTVIVWPDLEKVSAYGLAMFDVLVAVQATEVSDIQQLGEIVVKQVGDAPVRLLDVARIEAGFERAPGSPMLAVRAQVTADPAAVLRDVREVIAKLQPELPPGITVTETKPPTPPRPRAPLVVTVTGPELDQLDSIVDGYVAALKPHALGDVVRDPPAGEPEQIADPDRNAAARLGVPLADVLATLRVVGSMRVGTMTVAGARRPVVVKLPPMTLADALTRLHVKNHDGSIIPLSQIVTVRTGIARKIVRRNHERVMTLSIDVGGSQRAVAKKLIADLPVPTGYRVEVRR